MPLLIDFKSGAKLIINGAVIENAGPHSKLLIHNESAILREKEILSVGDTSTPAARVYFVLQCAYVFPDKRDEYLGKFEALVDEYIRAAPSAKPLATEIRRLIAGGDMYKALKRTQALIAHETEIFNELREATEARLEAMEGPDDT